MHVDCSPGRDSKIRTSAFTLVEVVLCVAIIAAVFGTIIAAYTQAAKRAQWSGYSLAAQALAMQYVEQARSAIYDPAQTQAGASGINQIASLVGTTWTRLDLPSSGSNYVTATNTITVRFVTNAPSVFQMICVQTVWPFAWGSSKRFYTNKICTFCAPDNRGDDTF